MNVCNKCELERRDPGMALCIGGPLHGHMRRMGPTDRLRVAVQKPRPPLVFRRIGSIDAPIDPPEYAVVDYELVRLDDLFVYVLSDGKLRELLS